MVWQIADETRCIKRRAGNEHEQSCTDVLQLESFMRTEDCRFAEKAASVQK